MKIKNLSKETKTVRDAGDHRGRTVSAGELGDFTDRCAAELLESFPDDWGFAPQTSAANPKEGES